MADCWLDYNLLTAGLSEGDNSVCIGGGGGVESGQLIQAPSELQL